MVNSFRTGGWNVVSLALEDNPQANSNVIVN